MTIDSAARTFADLRRAHPELSDSRLLNSNNQSEFKGGPDVAVIGAGIIGLCYAIHLKNTSPLLEFGFVMGCMECSTS